MTSRLRRSLSALAVVSLAAVPAVGARAQSQDADGLPLGPANLAETRQTSTLQAGVTLTTITRGQTGAGSTWTPRRRPCRTRPVPTPPWRS
jgi:hypothetical protein